MVGEPPELNRCRYTGLLEAHTGSLDAFSPSDRRFLLALAKLISGDAVDRLQALREAERLIGVNA